MSRLDTLSSVITLMKYDVIIIGAGPSGLAAAIRLKQLCLDNSKDLSVCILEKGAEVGAHIISGAIIEPPILDALLPDWQKPNTFSSTKVANEHFLFLMRKKSFRLPIIPRPLQNKDNLIISLSELCRWLGTVAENYGIEIYPGFAATKIVYDKNNTVIGVETGEMGIDHNGNKTENYQPGMKIFAKQVILAEGCRGSLTKTLFDKFNLRKSCDPQTYALGIKELWQVNPKNHCEGSVTHTIGWPLDRQTYGGGFLYHLEQNKIAVGLIVGLDYKNPTLSPFDELQRFKTHPKIAPLFKNGERLSFGARTLSEGGFQSIPQLTFPGGLLIGDCAGFQNVPKLKGISNAIKSGMIAAESLFDQLGKEKEIKEYSKKIKSSSIWNDLYQTRNIRPSFRYGLWTGVLYASFDIYCLKGQAPWTLKNHDDHNSLLLLNKTKVIHYSKPDDQLTFDKLSSIYLSDISYDEDQPSHIKLIKPKKAITINYKNYGSPEQFYCPASVYEIIKENGSHKLQINSANCIHCKACDIKDPTQNIDWHPPQSGDGPNYSGL